MKICQINNRFEPFSKGGAEVVVKNLKDGLSSVHVKNFVISTKPYFSNVKKTDSYYLSSIFHLLDRLPKVFRAIFHFIDIINVINFFKIYSILKKEKPDVVITHNLKGIGLTAVCAINKLKIKHVHILHDIQLLHPSGLMIYGKEKIVESFLARMYQKINQVFFRRTHLIISPSDWLKEMHIERGFFKFAKTRTWLNPYLKIANEQKLKTNNSFLFVGQLEKHKGIDILLKAMIELIKKNSFNGNLEIIGDGNYLQEAKNLVEKNDLQKKIIIHGRKNLEFIHKKMSMMKFMIVPSICYENSPTVIYEAVINNMVVIASDIGGIKEIVDYGSHLLIEPNNLTELKNSLIMAIKGEYEQVTKNDIYDEINLNKYIKKFTSLIAII